MKVNFPTWLRLLLSAVVTVGGYFVAGGYIDDETIRGLVAAFLAFIASAGIVPFRGGEINFSPAVRWLLTGVVTIGSYVLAAVADFDPTVRGIIGAAINLVSSLLIVPPPAEPEG